MASRSRSFKCIDGIRQPGLNEFGSSIHLRRLAGVFSTMPEPIVVAAGQVRQVRPEAPRRRRARNRVAVDAGVVHEHGLAFSGSRVAGKTLHGGLLLLIDPRRKVRRRLRINTDQHLGMLHSAKLRALAQEQAGLLRIEPHRVYAVGNHIRLARQPRHPEAVRHIHRRHGQISRRRTRPIAHRHMKLVGRHHSQLRIAILPPDTDARSRSRPSPRQASESTASPG